jgi:hypothetical protein
MRLHRHCYAAALVILGGCTHGSGQDALLGKWVNHRVVARRPAIVSIEFLPKDTVTISAIDALAAAGWGHPTTTSTGQYQVIAPNTLKITEELGSAVVNYHVDGTRLVLSGDGLEQLLGKTEPPQVLDETSQ